jgi:peptide deformylase
MLETMYAASGIGLAAPQVGVQERVIVVDVGEDPLVLVNPEISAADGEQVGLEGCLSVPDLVGEVRRAEWVRVTGLDRRGRPAGLEGEGLLARVLQHEIDHLDGILFVARIEDLSRLYRVSELSAAVEKEVAHI